MLVLYPVSPEKKIPVLLVITHCEQESPENLQHWLQERAGDVHIPGKKFVPNGSNHQVRPDATRWFKMCFIGLFRIP